MEKNTKICARPRHHRVAGMAPAKGWCRWLKMYKYKIQHNKMALHESCIASCHVHICTCIHKLWSFAGVLYNMKKKRKYVPSRDATESRAWRQRRAGAGGLKCINTKYNIIKWRCMSPASLAGMSTSAPAFTCSGPLQACYTT